MKVSKELVWTKGREEPCVGLEHGLELSSTFSLAAFAYKGT